MGRSWRRLRDRATGLAIQLRALVRRGAVEREMDEEHRFHLEMEAARLVREGMTPAEARRVARAAFGGVERYQEEVRRARWTTVVDDVWRDVTYALRTLRARPTFTVVVVATLGVAIGATTSVFGLADALFLRPLPVPDADRLVTVDLVRGRGGEGGSVSLPEYVDLREGAGDVLGLAAHHVSDITLSDGVAARPALGVDVSGNYFQVLGLRPAAGRFFTVEEASAESPAAVAVLSHELWWTRYGGDPGVVGGAIHVNGQPLAIVGVVPEGFHGAFAGARPAVWLPAGLHARLRPGRDIQSRTTMTWLQTFGRLADGVTTERARASLGMAAARMADMNTYPEEVEPVGAAVRPFTPLPPGARDVVPRVVLLLLAGAVVLLGIAAINVGGMLLARATARGPEMGMRLALGASRGRLVRQLCTEGLVLGLLGGAVGVALALLAGRGIGAIRPPGAAGFALDLGPNMRVLGFGLSTALLTALAFSLAPALHATRGGAAVARGRGRGGSSARFRGALVGGQVALALILTVSTALLFRTQQAALRVDHGFDPTGLLVAEINLRLNGYDEARGRVFLATLLERLAAEPAVASTALATSIPLGLGWDQTRARVPGHDAPDPSGHPVGYAAVSQGWFRTLGLPLLSGAEAGAASGEGPVPLVVNATFAERFWPDGSAVGRRLIMAGRDAVVTGVVPAGRYRSLSEEPSLFAYVSLESAYSPAVNIVIRPRGSRASAATALRRSLAALDRHVPALSVTSLERAMGQGLFLSRVAGTLLGLFAAVGLLLVATGTFGLLAFVVEERRREIGVRLAVGAGPGAVVRAVVGSALRPVLAGGVLGLVGALAATGALAGLLYDVGPRDPLSFAAAAAALLAVAAVAAWLPARRATRTDPASVLRVE